MSGCKLLCTRICAIRPIGCNCHASTLLSLHNSSTSRIFSDFFSEKLFRITLMCVCVCVCVKGDLISGRTSTDRRGAVCDAVADKETVLFRVSSDRRHDSVKG